MSENPWTAWNVEDVIVKAFQGRAHLHTLSTSTLAMVIKIDEPYDSQMITRLPFWLVAESSKIAFVDRMGYLTVAKDRDGPTGPIPIAPEEPDCPLNIEQVRTILLAAEKEFEA